jgi:hypothetical protein
MLKNVFVNSDVGVLNISLGGFLRSAEEVFGPKREKVTRSGKRMCIT